MPISSKDHEINTQKKHEFHGKNLLYFKKKMHILTSITNKTPQILSIIAKN